MKHYSPSQINMYLRCPAQWSYRYQHGLKIPPSSALVQGKSYHKAMEVNLVQKIESKADLSLYDVKEAYSTEFDSKIQEVEWSNEEKSIGIDKVKGELKDEGIKITELAHEKFNPFIQPKEVESAFEIHFDNTDYSLNGVIDVVSDDNVIIDHKTTSKTPNSISQSELIQGAVYCIAKNACQIMLNYAIKTKTPKTTSLFKQIDENDRSYVLRLVSSIDSNIKSGTIYPNRNSFSCSKRMCGYWNQCEKDWGGQVKE